MNTCRRRFLHLAAGAAVLPAMPRLASAQPYPTRPVRIIVGFPAGGAADIAARLVGQWLSERLDQPCVIENRAGAGGNIGTEAVVRAPADGHTLLMVNPPNAINATLYEQLNFNFLRDIVPVGSIYRQPYVLEVSPSLPIETVPDLIAYARANPGKLNMASSGIGSGSHVTGELFKMMAGIDMIHVPYRGGAPALADLIGGQVQVTFDLMNASIGHIRAGQVRPLAVTTTMRSETLPDVPSLGDFVPGYEASSWSGIGAPKNTPAEIVERLSKEIIAGLSDPKFNKRVADIGATVFSLSPVAFGKLLADETEKWSRVIKFAGIKAQ